MEEKKIIFCVEFVDGTRMPVKAMTEAEAYKIADKISNYRIAEIWVD